jgi:hypothetical protein
MVGATATIHPEPHLPRYGRCLRQLKLQDSILSLTQQQLGQGRHALTHHLVRYAHIARMSCIWWSSHKVTIPAAAFTAAAAAAQVPQYAPVRHHHHCGLWAPCEAGCQVTQALIVCICTRLGEHLACTMQQTMQLPTREKGQASAQAGASAAEAKQASPAL